MNKITCIQDAQEQVSQILTNVCQSTKRAPWTFPFTLSTASKEVKVEIMQSRLLKQNVLLQFQTAGVSSLTVWIFPS